MDVYYKEIKVKYYKCYVQVFDAPLKKEEFKYSPIGTHVQNSIAEVVVLCYDCSNKDTLDELESYFLPKLKIYYSGPILLCGTKKDLIVENKNNHVSLQMAKTFASAYQLTDIIECSSLIQLTENDNNVTKMFKKAIKIGLSHYYDINPENKELKRDKKFYCTLF